MRLTLGPLQYFWPRDQVLAFYRTAVTWPVDVIYLGETVCSKRRELRTRDWIELAHELAGAARKSCCRRWRCSRPESELASLGRLVETGLRVEANDMSAVQMLRERNLRFVGGPSLNVYNHAALRLLMEDGLERLVLGVEHGRGPSRSFVPRACRCRNWKSRPGAGCRFRIRRAASRRVRSTSPRTTAAFAASSTPTECRSPHGTARRS